MIGGVVLVMRSELWRWAEAELCCWSWWWRQQLSPRCFLLIHTNRSLPQHSHDANAHVIYWAWALIGPWREGSSVQAAQYHYSYGIIMLQLTLHTPGKGFQNLTTIYTTLFLHMFFGREKTTTIILYYKLGYCWWVCSLTCSNSLRASRWAGCQQQGMVSCQRTGQG